MKGILLDVFFVPERFPGFTEEVFLYIYMYIYSEEQGNILAKQAGDPGSKWTKQKGEIV